MGGYTAVKLTQYFNFQNLILFVPAMYSRRAYSLYFNDGFSKVIREKNSWFDSDAWDILNNFRGNLLLITAENDDIIPEDIVKKIFESATKSKNKFIHEVQGSPHQILSYLAERPKKFLKVVEQIVDHLSISSS
jgi:esterase/lipase